MTVVGCTGLLSPVCKGVGSVGSGVAGATAGAVLSAVTSWVVAGASWLLDQVGGVLTSTTSVDLGAGWFARHYAVMAGLTGVVVLPMLLLSVVQAVYRQSASALVRVVGVQLPLSLVLTGAAVQLVQLSLAATDALGSTVSAGAGTDIQKVLTGLAGTLVAQAGGGPTSVPAFVVLLGALLVVFGAFALWLELLVRAAAVYVAVLFLPLALASLVWPAVSHLCRRLVDTLVALVLSKFAIVAILSLAAAALSSGTGSGFSSVLGGAALLLLAAFAPFTLLRLVPAIDAGAVQQLEGVRHRMERAATGPVPRSAVHHALRAAQSSPLVQGEPGTGTATRYEAPGGDGGALANGRQAGAGAGRGDHGAGGAPGPGGGGARAGRGARHGGAGSDTGAVPSAGGAGDPAPPAPGELPGLPGIQQWRGQPPELNPDLSDIPRPPRERWDLADPLGRGPVPVWGAMAPDLLPEPPGDREDEHPRMAVHHDEVGPVLGGWDAGPSRGPVGPPGGGTGGTGGSGGREGGRPDAG